MTKHLKVESSSFRAVRLTAYKIISIDSSYTKLFLAITYSDKLVLFKGAFELEKETNGK